MNLYEKHLNVIRDTVTGDTPQIKAANLCEEITKEAMKEFAGWLHKNYAPATPTKWQKQNTKTPSTTPEGIKAWNATFKTTEQLLEEFLNLPQ